MKIKVLSALLCLSAQAFPQTIIIKFDSVLELSHHSTSVGPPKIFVHTLVGKGTVTGVAPSGSANFTCADGAKVPITLSLPGDTITNADVLAKSCLDSMRELLSNPLLGLEVTADVTNASVPQICGARVNGVRAYTELYFETGISYCRLYKK